MMKTRFFLCCEFLPMHRLLECQRLIDEKRCREIANTMGSHVQPIYAVRDTSYEQDHYWIVDGQHRLGAYEILCKRGHHHDIAVTYYRGIEKDAIESYQYERTGEGQPHKEAPIEELPVRKRIGQVLMNKPLVSFDENRVFRPKWNLHAYIDTYVECGGTLELTEAVWSQVNQMLKEERHNGICKDK